MTYRERARAIASKLTIAEKVRLTSADGFWGVAGIERLGIPPIRIVRAAPLSAASTFHRELIFALGAAEGARLRGDTPTLALCGGINVRRSPLADGSRHISEDPRLTGELIAAYIAGIQSSGVGVAAGIFPMDSQHAHRMSASHVIDERAFREIYLAPFEYVIKNAVPLAVVCAPSLTDGILTSANARVLNRILRNEWGFEGAVISDCCAVANRLDSLIAGVDLELPGAGRDTLDVVSAAIRCGELPESLLDDAAINMIAVSLSLLNTAISGEAVTEEAAPCEAPIDSGEADEDEAADEGEAAGAAEDEAAYGASVEIPSLDDLNLAAARGSTVLLKNEDNALPLASGTQLAVIGACAGDWAGENSELFAALRDAGFEPVFAAGLRDVGGAPVPALMEEARRAAVKAGTALIFAGGGAGEFPQANGAAACGQSDRNSLELPYALSVLIENLASSGAKLIAAISPKGAFELPWLGRFDAALVVHDGAAAAQALCDVLAGNASPSGRLTQSWPTLAADAPCSACFSGATANIEYRESVFVGYRYYQSARKAPLFPFGFGLSYTEFEYSGVRVDKQYITDNEDVLVSFDVTNTGEYYGGESVQLYVLHKNPVIFKPVRELRRFEKAFLAPGQSVTLSFRLSKRDFAYYNVAAGDHQVENGEYRLQIGASSDDIRLETRVYLRPTENDPLPNYVDTAPEYFSFSTDGEGRFSVSDASFESVLFSPIPSSALPNAAPISANATLGELLDYRMAQAELRRTRRLMRLFAGRIARARVPAELLSNPAEVPLRALPAISAGLVSTRRVKRFIARLNEKRARDEARRVKSAPGAVAAATADAEAAEEVEVLEAPAPESRELYLFPDSPEARSHDDK